MTLDSLNVFTASVMSGPPSPPPPPKFYKYRVSKQYWSGYPDKAQSYLASIHCWAIIADDGLLIVVF